MSNIIYTTTTTEDRVPNVEPDLVTRFRWRAERRCRKLNAKLRVPFYRWEAYPQDDGKWMVIAMQNIAVKYPRN